MTTELISAECCFPCPMVSEVERQRRLEQHRLGIWANGCVIEKEWRVRNLVFDKVGEKTTTMMRIRPAKTDDEVEFIVSKLEEIAQNRQNEK
jgi:serine protease inhibitor ecotin